jgi:hypothetical protein
VTLGHDFGDTIEITSGIRACDAVIASPPDSLTNGMRVSADGCQRGAKRRGIKPRQAIRASDAGVAAAKITSDDRAILAVRGRPVRAGVHRECVASLGGENSAQLPAAEVPIGVFAPDDIRV